MTFSFFNNYTYIHIEYYCFPSGNGMYVHNIGEQKKSSTKLNPGMDIFLIYIMFVLMIEKDTSVG